MAVRLCKFESCLGHLISRQKRKRFLSFPLFSYGRGKVVVRAFFETVSYNTSFNAEMSGDTTVTWGSRFRFTGCAIGSSVNPGIYI